MTGGQINYEHTIKRIVNEGFRLSKEVIGIYDLYYEWVMGLNETKRTPADKEYLKLYPQLPKKKHQKKENGPDQVEETEQQ